jgi:hypothetical protein
VYATSAATTRVLKVATRRPLRAGPVATFERLMLTR